MKCLATDDRLQIVATFCPKAISGCIASAALMFFCSSGLIGQDRPEDHEFFESRIRPVLIEYCYECHNEKRKEGGLSLDSRDGVRRGGDRGPAIAPGRGNESLLLKAIRHESDELKMPEGGAKLPERAIADLTQWIDRGAFDPRDHPPEPGDLVPDKLRDLIFAQRYRWWALQPLSVAEPPQIDESVLSQPVASSRSRLRPVSSEHPVDRFIRATLVEQGLVPSGQATREVLLRRAAFALTGLPPSQMEMERYGKDDNEAAFEDLVDRLLESPHYGERWARHWMDWIRYADSHGSEGDPAIPYAYQYRDYLIRALNQDVPYDQLVREHIAGDLIATPRIDAKSGIVESKLGPAHLRMVFHGFAPTDAMEEKVRFVDDQVNCVTKAFLGLTVSCARCHDHKFDPIRQTDYYALFGILASCHPGVVDARDRSQEASARERLKSTRANVRAALASVTSLDGQAIDLGAELNTESRSQSSPDAIHETLNKWQRQWTELRQEDEQARVQQASMKQFEGLFDLERWFAHGETSIGNSLPAGELCMAFGDSSRDLRFSPKGRATHGDALGQRGVLMSPRFELDDEYELWALVAGDGDAMIRYVVQDYPRNGTVYPVVYLNGGRWQWAKFDLSYWKGDTVHIELTTAPDSPVLAKDQHASWFAIRQVRLQKKGTRAPAKRDVESKAVLFENDAWSRVSDRAQLHAWAAEQTQKSWDRFRSGQMSDQDALWLNELLSRGIWERSVGNSGADSRLTAAIKEFRAELSQLAKPVRVPGVLESKGYNQRLLVRGDHRHPDSEVPRRFLSAFDENPYQTQGASGRLQLAESLASSKNPLFARVIVNRVWHHLFGRGIVSSTDNFGKLGELPSHPQLLDYLARRMIDDGWSIKRLVRFLVTSETWKQDSYPSEAARKSDPDNRWLSHANVLRLEAEAIRDAMLERSGILDAAMFGPSVTGDPPRRSLYLRVARNNLNSFLRTFDFPEPASTVGRRDVTNVPAQSLLLFNDARVAAYSKSLATRLESSSPRSLDGLGGKDRNRSDTDKASQLIQHVYSRSPNDSELQPIADFVAATREHLNQTARSADEAIMQRKQLERDEQQLLEEARNLVTLRNRTARGNDKPADAREASIRVPSPIASWEFDDLSDSISGKTGTLVGQAKIASGRLFLEGGFFKSSPLAVQVKAKTLEVWLKITDLSQQGGGAISIQSSDGSIFDAIVLGEQQPGHWLAGSDHFRRTKPFMGKEETEKASDLHLAIVYDTEGNITAFRNGRVYGSGYRAEHVAEFAAGESVVTVGLRHLPKGGNRVLRAEIERAKLYDRALSEKEVLASFEGAPHEAGEAEWIQALSAERREQLLGIREQIRGIDLRIKELAPVSEGDREIVVWTEVVKALFASKEFLFVR